MFEFFLPLGCLSSFKEYDLTVSLRCKTFFADVTQLRERIRATTSLSHCGFVIHATDLHRLTRRQMTATYHRKLDNSPHGNRAE